MFKIYDGRKAFYQWDLNRKLIVEDKSVKEVHFCNRTSDCSLITEVYELDGLYVADVPNILLQDSWDIKVYAYDSEYTKHCETYDVIARTRPDDYVYTETEQRKWEHLEARIDEIEQNGISEEAIENAVDKYLDENGVEVDMTGIATEEYVQEQIAGIEHPTTDLTGYATEKYVDEKIANIDIPEAEEVDLSNYYTKTETDSAINAVKDTIPSTSGLATESYVQDEISKIEHPVTDLSDYYKKSEVDELIENIDIPESSGGTGSAVEEVYVGTEEPTDASYKLWINPDEEGGSVKVDGTTIVKSLDGTISAAIGGGKTLAVEPVVVSEYTLPSNSNGFTTVSSSNDRYASGMYDFLSELDKNVTYTVELGFRNVNTAVDGTCVGTITYDYAFSSLYPWKADGLAVFDDTIIGLGYTSATQGVFLQGSDASTAYSAYYINTFRVLTPAEYTYNKIESGYINAGSGLQVNGYGELETTLGGLDMVDGLHLIMTNGSNTNYSTKTYNVALGKNNIIGGASDTGIALGQGNSISPTAGSGFVAAGRENVITGGYGATAVGYQNRVEGKMAVAMGCGAYATGDSQTVYGKWNLADSSYTVIIGNGTSSSNRADGLTIDSSGNIVTQGTVSNGGADYAEYFEWADGNEGNEDRIGLIVTLEGNKIRLAQAGDDILGIVSGTATVLGDDAEWHWHGKYLRDEFGRVQTKVIQLYDDEGNPDGYATVPVVNPEYDEKQHYVPRSERAAWDVIGMMGKLYVRDDGSCVVGGYAAVAADGLASFSTGRTNMRVMERISDGIVRVLLK